MKSNLGTILYAAGLGLVCALLLTAAGELTRERHEANKRAEKHRSVLDALGVDVEGQASSERINKLFEEKVREETRGKLTLFVSTGQEGKAYALPFAGPGLWAPVKGFLSLEKDLETIRGVTFYQQEETPGLGGEIAALCGCAPGGDWKNCSAKFRHQFRGKKIVDEAGKPGIRILRGGGAEKQNEVDGISGATMTCDKVEDMLNAAIGDLVKERGKNAR